MAALLCNCRLPVRSRVLLFNANPGEENLPVFIFSPLYRKYNSKLLTISVHSNFEAFPQPAGLALIAPGDVDRASVALFAVICKISSNAALEKSSTSITS